jgi:hypothetical protein
MLAADKLQLQSLMKQQAVTLKEKEFNLHHSNCMTIGTQAAVLAGLDITMFIEFTPISLRDFLYGPEVADAVVTHSHHAAAAVSTMLQPPSGTHHHWRSLAAAVISSAAVASSSRNTKSDYDSSDSADSNNISSNTNTNSNGNVESTSPWMQEYIFYYTMTYHLLHFLYYSLICTAFCCNVIVVAQTTILSVLGAGLALRGPDGSMMTATNILYQERSYIFRIFGYGLTFTILSVFVGVWLMFQHWATALSCWFIATYTCYFIYSNYQRVSKLLYFHDNESVDLHDLLSMTQQQHQYPGSKPSTTASKSQLQHQRHRSNHSNESAATGDDYYDDDDTLYSSENPETESFMHQNHSLGIGNNNNNKSRRRRSKYSRNNVISTIQMV